MKIGELAHTAGVTTKTIRYYESIGLLDEPARTQAGYRSYGPAAIERLGFVKQAQASGLALAEIKSILEIKDRGGQSCEHTRALLKGHLDDVDAKIAELPRGQDDAPRDVRPRCRARPRHVHRCQPLPGDHRHHPRQLTKTLGA